MTDNAVHLNLDNAWPERVLDCPFRTETQWGKRLRYVARKRDIDAFYWEVNAWAFPFILYGSGDFHHLAGVMIRRIEQTPFTLVSFDNHPDWDVKPPYWSCGGWAARALKTGRVKRVSVWGCGNFELQWPARIFADWRAIKAGKFEIHAWAERQKPAEQKLFNCMTRENWRQRFSEFAESLSGENLYVTIDMDCLRKEEAVTNWENGLFTADDVAWAVGLLRENANLVGGDMCGAYSVPEYERFGQRFAGNWDHPKIPTPNLAEAAEINLKSLQTIWPALTGSAST
jgi:arginase family enzyme